MAMMRDAPRRKPERAAESIGWNSCELTRDWGLEQFHLVVGLRRFGTRRFLAPFHAFQSTRSWIFGPVFAKLLTLSETGMASKKSACAGLMQVGDVTQAPASCNRASGQNRSRSMTTGMRSWMKAQIFAGAGREDRARIDLRALWRSPRARRGRQRRQFRHCAA